MLHPFPRIAAAFALAVAMTTFTGGALAGNGPGNENPPGQIKQELGIQSAQTIAQAADAQAAGEQHAAAQQSGQQQSSGVSKGQEKKQANASVSSTMHSSSSASDTGPGVKPSNSTTKWTHCKTGGTTAATATCTAQAGTPNTEADVSKQYGNGKTAAQIAVSRGAPAGTLITGPGNSQPHKVSDCRHKSNRSGGVDVHAVKSYSTTNCVRATQTTLVAPCGFVVVAQTTVVGKSHGHGQGLSHNKHLQTTTSSTLKPDSSQKCGSAAVTPQTAITTSVSTNISSATRTPNANANANANANNANANANANASALPTTSAAPVTNTGGVLGVQKTLAKPKAKHAVLGTVGNVAGSSLPFTGFPVWLAVVVALALIAAGFMLRRRSDVSRP